MTHRVLAIIVCYNPSAEALEVSLNALTDQVAQIILVDNASSNGAEIEQAISQSVVSDKSILARQDSNLGLGAAHNIGIEHARKAGFDYILLLDQDSVPLPDMVAHLLSASIIKSMDGGKVSAVGATYLNADNGSESFFVRFGKLKFQRQYCQNRDENGCIKADFLISSGSLIALSALDEIGLMDETLFIDHVDTEWFLRAKSKSYQAYGVCDGVMQHGLGEVTHRINLRRQRNVPQHKPFRYYYIFRNSVNLYCRGYTSWLWKWNDLQRLGMIAIMFGIIKAPRWENSKMMIKGIFDGLRGISGSLNDD